MKNLLPIATQHFDNAGKVLGSGKVYVYDAGTLTPATIYADIDGAGVLSNPVILNSAGRVSNGQIFVDNEFYDVVVTTAGGTTVEVVSSVCGIVSFGQSVTPSVVFEETFTATAGQASFLLSNSYAVSSHTLQVFVNGSAQVAGTDYAETSSTSITFASGLNADDVVNTRIFDVAPSVSTTAALTLVTDTAGYYATNTVEGVLAEIGDAVFAVDSSAYITPQQYGAVGNGVDDDTVAIKAFFDACFNDGRRGFIPAGEYVVQAGNLVYDNGFVEKTFPVIDTAGYQAVTFLAKDGTDAPFLTISNGTATGSAGKYWLGGRLGGFTYSQNGKTAASGQHVLDLRGCWKTEFGYIRGLDNGGDILHYGQALYAGSNPDPYALTFLSFDGLEGARNGGRVLFNDNWVGLNGCTFKAIRAIETGLGAIYGFGAANTFGFISAGECRGWAIDDGTASAVTGGSPSRINISMAEIDGCENGVKLNRTQASDLVGFRFIHRYRFAPNTTSLYWPRTCLDLCGGSLAGNVFELDFQTMHRVEAAMSSSALNLVVGPNPITTTSGSSTITFTTTDDHTFANGWTVAIQGATNTGGIAAADINGDRVITVTGMKTFTVTAGAAATASTTGGGTAVKLSPLEALGTFINCHNNASINGRFEQYEDNNAGFATLTAEPDRLVSNFTINSNAVFTRLYRPLYDSQVKNGVTVRGTSGIAIGSTVGAAGKLILGTVVYNRANQYDSTTGVWTAPFNGWVRFDSSVMATWAGTSTIAVGFNDSTGTYQGVACSSSHTITGNTTLQHTWVVQVTKGNQYFLLAATGTGSTTTTTAYGNETSFSAYPLTN